MTNRDAETARLRYAFIERTLVIVILGLVAVGALVGILFGDDKALLVSILTTDIAALSALWSSKGRDLSTTTTNKDLPPTLVTVTNKGRRS